MLVDPRLAAKARERLADPGDVLTQAVATPSAKREPSAEEAKFTAAIQRLNDLSDVDPPKRARGHQALRLLAATETWSLVAVLVAQTHLHIGL